MHERIGPYRVEGEIGRGGMGVVYRAVDERLDRVVAIKALPEELARDAGRLERFEREARTLASLSHPNLAGIYGVEEREGHRFLVLEFVDGETLAERLDRGAIGVEAALEIGVQIAAGVEAAHDAGVIHRDLKPANIKISSDGVAKVLDFGLARADEGGASTGSGFSQSPTMTSPVHSPSPQHSPTIAGAILGTAAYMSPEQARGRKVDRRSDVWSFGVLLYEMLVGSSPFVGETATDSIGAVLHEDPDLTRLPAGTPRRVRELVRRCLERDKGRRLQSIGDARVVLTEAMEAIERGEGSMDLAAAPARTSPLWPIAVVVLLGAVVVLGWQALTSAGGGSAAPVFRASFSAVKQLTDLPGVEEYPALSPDGHVVAGRGETGVHERCGHAPVRA